jgi:hypothetical protein
MKLKFAVALSCLMGISTGAFAQLQFQYQELPKDRTSMEFGPQIKAFDKAIGGYKWAAENGSGFIISSTKNPMPTSDSNRVVNGMYFVMQRFAFDQEQITPMPITLYARKSEREGFVELWDESSESLHIRVVDENTLEVVRYPKERDERDRVFYKKVEQFAKNPHASRLKSAEEDGTFY